MGVLVEHRQPNLAGVWRLSLSGNATLALETAVGITMGTPEYNASTNTLIVDVTIAEGKYPAVQDLVIVSFTDTQRNASAPHGSGFTHLRFTMPDYVDEASTLVSNRTLAILSVFDHLRFMGVTGTNNYGWLCGGDDPYACSVIEWTDRSVGI